MEPLISLKKADILGGGEKVLYGVDLEIGRGDFVYIVGKVGTGKTSLIRSFTAENPLGGGEGTVCGFRLNHIRRRDIPFLRRRIGVVFQDFQLLSDRSVHDNLLFVLKATGWKEREKAEARIDEVLEAVAMTTKAHKFPHQLSGGEQQRIAIARALLNEPELILADEPTGNLDSETADGIMQLLTGLNREKGAAVVMVTHNRSIFEQYPGRVFVCTDESCREKVIDDIIDLDITL
ncbi:MAG: ATP-binding cassette domain-containing protein [Bacteroidales bacterium]|nr:ATP-binding cassette domain-containing protein [Bacteroidales bacterium]